MKNLILTIFAFIFFISCKEKSDINPTGFYELQGKDVDGNSIGYSGEIRVKQIENGKIVVNFCITNGYPTYNQGTFIDTLRYEHNMAVYKDEDLKKACTLKFLFSKDGVELKENANYEYGNCWGNGVVANGYFKKASAKIPNDKELIEE
jgi:hypothetical protein